MLSQQYGNVWLRALVDWPGYWAGEDGHIYSDKRGILIPLKDKLNKENKIWYVGLYRDDIRYRRLLRSGNYAMCVRVTPIAIHTLIASVWLPPKPSPLHEINHIDLDRSNNAPTNLEWVTNQGNVDHFRAARPLFGRGEDNPCHKLTTQDVLSIRGMAGTATLATIAKQHRISMTQACNIINRHAWTHI